MWKIGRRHDDIKSNKWKIIIQLQQDPEVG